MFHRRRWQRFTKSERIQTDPGQATTEYALVLIGAAVIALLVVAWATDGGGAGRIGELFDSALSNVLSRTETIDE
ncbi:MAG: hypothetical protein RL419_300 [Actinomycetota bacterium]|jgi:hypothetical protein